MYRKALEKELLASHRSLALHVSRIYQYTWTWDLESLSKAGR